MIVPHLRTLPLMGGKSEETTTSTAFYGTSQAPAQGQNQKAAPAQAQPVALAKPAPRPAPRSLGRPSNPPPANAATYGVKDPQDAAQQQTKQMMLIVQAQITAQQQQRPQALPQGQVLQMRVMAGEAPAAEERKPRLMEMRPIGSRADQPVPTGNPSHDLAAELSVQPIAPYPSPLYKSHFTVTNNSGAPMRGFEVFGDAGDHWSVSLEPGQSMNLLGTKPDTRLWGK
jgi:hypothetical protein